ncbi:hypothetical protein B0H14DRAFT_3138995 [Mycena olivaceomarginata]|nr:hypothetical protein B0H14DRAFT_3138995 [Mycena olivaceomarginata]
MGRLNIQPFLRWFPWILVVALYPNIPIEDGIQINSRLFPAPRSKIKKSIRASLKPNKDGNYAPKEDHLNIFDLTQNIVKGTQCAVNVVLCARIALMVYRKHPGVKFWDELDKHLAKIRAEAKGDMKQVTRAFRHILTEDQDTHGAKTYELDENTVDTFQEGVDALIEAGTKDALGMRDDA